MPCGPTRLGPMRDWMRAAMRRSIQLTGPAKIATKAKARKAAIPMTTACTSQAQGQRAGSAWKRLRIRRSARCWMMFTDRSPVR